MQVFDYIYYRVAKLFVKRDGSNAVTAIATVSIIQFLILGDVVTIIARMFYSLDEIAAFKWPVKISYIGLFFAGLIFARNYFHYIKKYWTLSSYWGNKENSSQRHVRGWLVVLAILLPFVVLILLGTVFGRK